jgi:hypothetical protein
LFYKFFANHQKLGTKMMNPNRKSAKIKQYGIVAGLTTISLIVSQAFFFPVNSAQQLFCTGSMNNGWNHNAEFVNGRFTQIRWQRAGQPPQVTTLTFDTTNAKGEPIYRGTFMAATKVTLVDISRGDVRSGSQISVGVEEWGWSRGTCRT